ncbi:CoB--CoM heterodisulfide reductase subunit C [Methanobacterium petrolearium]|uniref:CoB--CoM heterodisulfide reductase subunit C n=1 Tax=Methanobacterium petrolearium TaxID=710190 RepID=UPI001AEA23B7|nr:CoB--CoM heterodisulfide reductase subunit C [Methanobacterium petrolearium]MBP1945617.1 heterodisulfide reductase subunit C [Methanobacterium petrolearium]
MSFLKRLKNVFSGEDDSEKKEEAVKSEKDKPPVEEKETRAQEKANEVPAEEKPEKVEDKPAEEKTKDSIAAEKAETKKEKKPEKAEAEKPVKSEKKPKKERSESMTLLQKDEAIVTRADIDENFKQEIIDAGGESLGICFQCGTCTAACPSGRRTPYRIRQLVRRSLIGLKEDVIPDDTLWMCTTCYECQERCPRGIKIVDIVKIVRNYAAQAGYMGKAHKMVGSFVIKTGHGVPINPQTKELRKSVGLDELPPTTHSFPEALEEVQTIVKATQFDNLIGYNWETETID